MERAIYLIKITLDGQALKVVVIVLVLLLTLGGELDVSTEDKGINPNVQHQQSQQSPLMNKEHQSFL